MSSTCETIKVGKFFPNYMIFDSFIMLYCFIMLWNIFSVFFKPSTIVALEFPKNIFEGECGRPTTKVSGTLDVFKSTITRLTSNSPS